MQYWAFLLNKIGRNYDDEVGNISYANDIQLILVNIISELKRESYYTKYTGSIAR